MLYVYVYMNYDVLLLIFLTESFHTCIVYKLEGFFEMIYMESEYHLKSIYGDAISYSGTHIQYDEIHFQSSDDL